MPRIMIRKSPTRGYTLLELIVSIGIFSMVMLAVTGAYLALISLDRQARAGSQLASSLSFAIDSMSRSLRTGTEYACNGNPSSPNCPAGGNSISFLDGDGEIITYLLKDDGSIGQCSTALCTDAVAVSVTDPRIDIESLRFFVRGVGTTGSNAPIQPQVTFSVTGSMTTDAGESLDFSIQTGATQRLIEL